MRIHKVMQHLPWRTVVLQGERQRLIIVMGQGVAAEQVLVVLRHRRLLVALSDCERVLARIRGYRTCRKHAGHQDAEGERHCENKEPERNTVLMIRKRILQPAGKRTRMIMRDEIKAPMIINAWNLLRLDPKATMRDVSKLAWHGRVGQNFPIII
jgi:hypothetical protein